MMTTKETAILMYVLFFPFLSISDLFGQKEEDIYFKKHVILEEFVSEGVAVADINRDGLMDIIAGSFWFEAPDWKRHELSDPQFFEYDKDYSNAFLHFVLDVNQDGWVDIIRIGFPGEEVVWYENPKNEPGHWKEHVIHNNFGNETPVFVDMNGDGRPDLVGNDPEKEEVIWLEAPQKGDLHWNKHVISKKPGLATDRFTHGIGVGDIDADGSKEILISKGWWKQSKSGHWGFHEADLGEDCAQMHVYDVNNDGRMDVISSSAHTYGIWWHEQVRAVDGSVHWVKHVIDSTFSQSHALAVSDIRGNGNVDLITGKRFFAHNGQDPGALEPAVLYWYEYIPEGPPYWKAHKIDDDSGVGLQVVVEDVNGNGLSDIVVSNKKGVFFFEQKRKHK